MWKQVSGCLYPLDQSAPQWMPMINYQLYCLGIASFRKQWAQFSQITIYLQPTRSGAWVSSIRPELLTLDVSTDFNKSVLKKASILTTLTKVINHCFLSQSLMSFLFVHTVLSITSKSDNKVFVLLVCLLPHTSPWGRRANLFDLSHSWGSSIMEWGISLSGDPQQHVCVCILEEFECVRKRR